MKSFIGWFAMPGHEGGGCDWFQRGVEAAAYTRVLAGPGFGFAFEPDGGRFSVHQAGGSAGVVAGAARWDGASVEEPAVNLSAAYRDQGEEALGRLTEAALVWLAPAGGRAGLVACDRIGRTRVYHRRVDGILMFSSSALDLAGRGLPPASVDPQALYNYIYFHVIPGPRTAFRDIFILPPASYLQARSAEPLIQRYWCLKYPEDYQGPEAEQQFRDLIESDVRRCYEPGHTGAFLSGGLDSSTVSGMLAKVKGQQQTDTFSIGFSQAGYDEMEYARITARHFGTNQHEYYVVPDDIVALVPKIAATYSEPFGNSSTVPAYYCARMALDNGMQLLLAGDGGDELFGGNDRYRKQLIFEAYHGLPGWLRRGLVEPLAMNRLVRGTPLIRKASRYVEQANIPLPDRFETYNTLHWIGLRKVLRDDIVDAVDVDDPIKHLRGIYGRVDSSKPINRMLGLDMQITLADNDLPKVDGMCRLAGLRVEYPLISDAMLEFSGHIPVADKVSRRELRIFYKRSLRDFLAPETISKQKHGFGLPVGQWMYTHKAYNELTRDSLRKLADRGVLQHAFVDEFFAKLLPEHNGFYGSFGWVLLMLEQWLSAHDLSV